MCDLLLKNPIFDVEVSVFPIIKRWLTLSFFCFKYLYASSSLSNFRRYRSSALCAVWLVENKRVLVEIESNRPLVVFKPESGMELVDFKQAVVESFQDVLSMTDINYL